jgi:glycosyltransferase involved in cell wall biosynthesis
MMDTVDDHETGFLVKPADPESLSEALIELSNDRMEMQRMGGQARERATQKFDWPVIAREYKTLLDEIVRR